MSHRGCNRAAAIPAPDLHLVMCLLTGSLSGRKASFPSASEQIPSHLIGRTVTHAPGLPQTPREGRDHEYPPSPVTGQGPSQRGFTQELHVCQEEAGAHAGQEPSGLGRCPSLLCGLVSRELEPLGPCFQLPCSTGPCSLPGMGQWLPRNLIEASFCGIGCGQISDTWVPWRTRFQRHPAPRVQIWASDSSLHQPFF